MILVGIIIGLIMAHLWPLFGYRERFTNPLWPVPAESDPLDITTPGRGVHPPPTADEGGEDDPRDLPWIASWSPLDAEARRGNNCLVHSTEEGPDDTLIQVVSKSCESGMAHTRAPNRIIIPDSIPEALRHDTIQHEAIHIAQRRHPNAWIDFYRRNWSFVFHNGPPADMPRSVVEARRANPDTWDPNTGGPWPCWQGRWWPVPVYRTATDPRLRDAATVWYDGWRRETRDYPPEVWQQFFGRPSQDEHPHELAAVMIVGEDTVSEAGRRLWTWWRANKSFVSSAK